MGLYLVLGGALGGAQLSLSLTRTHSLKTYVRCCPRSKNETKDITSATKELEARKGLNIMIQKYF